MAIKGNINVKRDDGKFFQITLKQIYELREINLGLFYAQNKERRIKKNYFFLRSVLEDYCHCKSVIWVKKMNVDIVDDDEEEKKNANGIEMP